MRLLAITLVVLALVCAAHAYCDATLSVENNVMKLSCGKLFAELSSSASKSVQGRIVYEGVVHDDLSQGEATLTMEKGQLDGQFVFPSGSTYKITRGVGVNSVRVTAVDASARAERNVELSAITGLVLNSQDCGAGTVVVKNNDTVHNDFPSSSYSGWIGIFLGSVQGDCGDWSSFVDSQYTVAATETYTFTNAAYLTNTIVACYYSSGDTLVTSLTISSCATAGGASLDLEFDSSGSSIEITSTYVDSTSYPAAFTTTTGSGSPSEPANSWTIASGVVTPGTNVAGTYLTVMSARSQSSLNLGVVELHVLFRQGSSGGIDTILPINTAPVTRTFSVATSGTLAISALIVSQGSPAEESTASVSTVIDVNMVKISS